MLTSPFRAAGFVLSSSDREHRHRNCRSSTSRKKEVFSEAKARVLM